jgi:hypothetical protein
MRQSQFCAPIDTEPRLRFVDARRASPKRDPEARHVQFSLIEARLSCEFERTRDRRTRYPVDESGGGRSSPISPGMSATKFLAMATSII